MENRSRAISLSELLFFTTLGGSFFLFGFSKKVSAWKKKLPSINGENSNLVFHEGQELAVKALKRGTLLALIGCSTIFVAGYAAFRILDLKSLSKKSIEEERKTTISTLQDLVDQILKK